MTHISISKWQSQTNGEYTTHTHIHIHIYNENIESSKTHSPHFKMMSFNIKPFPALKLISSNSFKIFYHIWIFYVAIDYILPFRVKYLTIELNSMIILNSFTTIYYTNIYLYVIAIRISLSLQFWLIVYRKPDVESISYRI